LTTSPRAYARALARSEHGRSAIRTRVRLVFRLVPNIPPASPETGRHAQVEAPWAPRSASLKSASSRGLALDLFSLELSDRERSDRHVSDDIVSGDAANAKLTMSRNLKGQAAERARTRSPKQMSPHNFSFIVKVLCTDVIPLTAQN